MNINLRSVGGIFPGQVTLSIAAFCWTPEDMTKLISFVAYEMNAKYLIITRIYLSKHILIQHSDYFKEIYILSGGESKKLLYR